jgi:hypothetical protein
MIDFGEDLTSKVLVRIKTDGEMSVHSIPVDWPEDAVDDMANELLNTEGAEKHDLGEDSVGVMRTVVYCYNQSYKLEHNKPLTDGLMEALNTLVMLNGDVVLALSPTFMEAL